jgi:hypothetical protein
MVWENFCKNRRTRFFLNFLLEIFFDDKNNFVEKGTRFKISNPVYLPVFLRVDHIQIQQRPLPVRFEDGVKNEVICRHTFLEMVRVFNNNNKNNNR